MFYLLRVYSNHIRVDIFESAFVDRDVSEALAIVKELGETTFGMGDIVTVFLFYVSVEIFDG
jgi:hypothetical protein